MLKKIGIVLAVIVLLVAAAVGGFYIRFQSMVNNIQRQYENIKPIDLSRVADGVYEGSFGDFLVSARVAVTIKAHRIDQIKILEQHCGPGYEALDVLDRIVKVQQPKVDAVTGATGSSKSIMIAVYRALTGK